MAGQPFDPDAADSDYGSDYDGMPPQVSSDTESEHDVDLIRLKVLILSETPLGWASKKPRGCKRQAEQ